MDAIHELICPKCDESVSGPDQKAVKATMDRHMAKRHGAKK